MKYILFIILGFLIAGCETLPENSEKWMERERNACLPTAISFREGLRKYNLWAEVVSYSYIDYKSNTLLGNVTKGKPSSRYYKFGEYYKFR